MADSSPVSRLRGLPSLIAGTLGGSQTYGPAVRTPYGLDRAFRTAKTQKPETPATPEVNPYLILDMTAKQMEEMSKQSPQGRRGSGLTGLWNKRASATRYRQAKHLFAWNHWVADSLRRDYGVPNEKISVVSPGVDINLFQPDASAKMNDGVVRILFVGNDFLRKGGDLLLRWARETMVSTPWEVHVVTQDLVPETAGVVVHAGLSNSSTELVRLYQKCDLLALPTRSDCYSLVALEAMATGLPVISSRIGGIPEIVSEGATGFLTEVDDFAALTSALDRLVSDTRLRQSMGDAARARATRHFDCKINLKRVLEIMQAPVPAAQPVNRSYPAHSRVAPMPR